MYLSAPPGAMPRRSRNNTAAERGTAALGPQQLWCIIIFPECVARVPVSLWGSGGWGCVRSTLRLRPQSFATVHNRSQPFATVRNRSQLFATVRNRPRDCYMAMPMVSSAEGVLFGGFKRLVVSFRVAGVALRDIQMRFVTCRKSFCVAGAIL